MAMGRGDRDIAGMRANLALALVATIAVGAGCRPAADPAASGGPDLEWSGPPGSSKPFLTAGSDGELLLSWLEPRSDGRHALRLAMTRDGRWSDPKTVAESDRFFVNWADFPSVTRAGPGTLVVHWLEKTEAKPYAYHVRLTVSRDDGATWSDPITAHQDRSPTEHGFAAMVPGPDGSVAIAWLDGGAMVNPGGAMTARVATLSADGSLGAETVLDPRTCECCQLAMTRATPGLVAAYRDRTDVEVRDIAVVREVDGRWTEPVIVANDGWVLKGCPVNGPSIAAAGHHVGVAWFTGARDTARVLVAFSQDGGATFGPPIRADEGAPLGRVHFQMTGADSGVVVWLETSGDGAAWRVRRIAGGAAEPASTVGVTSRARDAGFPRTALVGGDLYVAWTEPGESPDGPRVRVSRVR